ncbi:ActR/PrrA/RegA family redox response regulator transcription factor [Alphaproteobacteria bacterium]|jgi:two-component system response regulator RegA|nr:ActR/PrrA/RegA family redox response regulator transcription factor [Alphaproteobacteria bacterium]
MAVTDKTLLILDDDAPLRGRLRRAMEVRGFDVMDSGTVQDGVEMVRKTPPAYAILDMKLEDGTGLTLVQELRKKRADCRIVMLTGFGNIATAVAAVKAGALDYLPKPADPDQITAALTQSGDEMPPPPQDPMSADRVRWEHIQRVYEQCGRNVSETARRLRMHRRTLQRILSKHAPRD